jgi:transcriptional regulator with XRE-family HTH domain
MSNTMTYGGWATERSSTGGSFSLVQVVGWMAAAGVVLGTLGTGNDPQVENLQRAATKALHVASFAEVAEAAEARTPREDLVRIRAVLSPAVSDLANAFGVTRQSVYNWLNGDPVAEENAAKLRDLAQAADVLAHEGVVVNSALLKRKIAHGKTLFQVAQAGMSARDAALLLLQIHRREQAQRERLNARGAVRGKSDATADFDLPVFTDNA